MALTLRFRDKFYCRVLRTLGWHHKSSLETFLWFYLIHFFYTLELLATWFPLDGIHSLCEPQEWLDANWKWKMSPEPPTRQECIVNVKLQFWANYSFISFFMQQPPMKPHSMILLTKASSEGWWINAAFIPQMTGGQTVLCLTKISFYKRTEDQ